jgi:cytidylate kinase
VRIIAPLEQRIDNVADKRGCSLAEAQEYVFKRDHDRRVFVMKYFHEDIADAAHYDLVVNRAEISIDEATRIIKQAFQARNFYIP